MAVNFSKPKQPAANEFDQHLTSTQAKGHTEVVKVSSQKTGDKKEQIIKDSTEVVNTGVVIPTDKLCRIRVEGGHTANLGNYESARVSVSLEMPCTKEDLDAAYDFASDWVSKKIEESVNQAA